MLNGRVYMELEKHQYSKSLLFTKEEKTCMNMSSQTCVSHDFLQRDLSKAAMNLVNKKMTLRKMAMHTYRGKKVNLLLDAFSIIKRYSMLIEGVEQIRDEGTKSISRGLRFIDAILEVSGIKIPVDAMQYVDKELGKDAWKSKSTIAIEIIEQLKDKFNMGIVFADAHFATKEFIGYLNSQQMNYLMRFPSNRKVLIGGNEKRIDEALKLKGNAKSKRIKGSFNGVLCYFYVVKHDNGRLM